MTLVGADPYEQLRAAIVSGELQPNERLVEADLSARLGAGRSAVRTALTRLAQEGLIEQERNRGARVRKIGKEEAIQIYEARAARRRRPARRVRLPHDPRAGPRGAVVRGAQRGRRSGLRG